MSATPLPLDGLRVIEVGFMWAAPMACRILGDLGADVIKVEAPHHPEPVRFSIYPSNDMGERPWERGAHYQKNSRSKRSLVLDLRDARAQAVFKRLIAVSDVLVENNTPRVMANFGLDYDVLRAVKPNLIYLSMPGFGASGPCRDYLAFGTTVEGFSGLSSVTGYEGEGPVRSAIPYGDPVAALHGVIAVLAALRHRRATGDGQFIELAQAESLLALQADALLDAAINRRNVGRRGDRHRTFAPQNVYRCADAPDGQDRWLALTVASDADWRRLCTVLGQPALAADPRFASAAARKAREPEADQIIAAWARQQDPRDAMHLLQDAGVAAGVVQTPREVVEDPQLAARGYWWQVPHPLYHAPSYAGMPFRLSHTPARATHHAPLFGEHTTAILTGLLGLTSAEIDALRRDTITADTPLVPGLTIPAPGKP